MQGPIEKEEVYSVDFLKAHIFICLLLLLFVLWVGCLLCVFSLCAYFSPPLPLPLPL